MGGYADAKARIYQRQEGGDCHVGNRDDFESAEVSRKCRCALRWFGWGPPANDADGGVVDGRVIVSGEDLGAPADVARPLLLDAAASALAAHAFGVPAPAIRQGMAGFGPLPHRGAEVARAGMVRFLDDSKATNPHAALAALEGRAGAVLIAGGLAKGVDLTPLAAAAPALVAVIALGEAAPEISVVFDGLTPVRRAKSIEEAVRLAYEEARSAGEPADVILAPACASQDMFRDYRERGERFAAAARRLAGHPAGVGRSNA
jgi:UDP-N-acetylmuramoylalanine--D-glutamate ligase